MKKIGLIGFMGLYVSTAFAIENENGCIFSGEVVAPYVSIWVEDETLVAEATLYYQERGYTKAQIEKTLKNNDWTGFRLECVPVVSETSDNPPSTIGQNLVITSYQMSFTSVSLDYFKSINKAKLLADDN
jgi:hypothetical protein